jgi:hypothetical protein
MQRKIGSAFGLKFEITRGFTIVIWLLVAGIFIGMVAFLCLVLDGR